MVFHGGNVLWVNSHIQEIPENGADAAHLMAVHGDTVLSGASCGQRSWMWSLCGSHGWEGNWYAKPEDSHRHVAISELKHYLRFFNKYRLFDVDIVAEQVTILFKTTPIGVSATCYPPVDGSWIGATQLDVIVW